MTEEIFDRLNTRRHELINKKWDVGLTAAEEKIFDRLQNSELLDYFIGHLDFRPLIRMHSELKQMGRRLFPKGSRYPRAPRPPVAA